MGNQELRKEFRLSSIPESQIVPLLRGSVF